MNDATRNEIANCLEELSAQDRWNGDLWQRCYDLVGANADDGLVAYLHDDLIHYTGRPLFSSEPHPSVLQTYAQEFRDFATAIRSGMSLAHFKELYPW